MRAPAIRKCANPLVMDTLVVMRSARVAVVLDVCCVLVFVVIGRASHTKGESLAGIARVDRRARPVVDTARRPAQLGQAGLADDPGAPLPGGRHDRSVGMGSFCHLGDDRASRRRRQPRHVDAVLDREPGAGVTAVRITRDADHPGTHPLMITRLAENKINKRPCAPP